MIRIKVHCVKPLDTAGRSFDGSELLTMSDQSVAAWLFAPIRWAPPPMVTCAFFRLLNLGLAEPLREGELDFLVDRCLRIRVDDLDLEWRVTLSSRQRLVPAPERKSDAMVAGAAADLLLLAARREDPDTLFFQRRLRLSGDTELGLNVKNLMDSLELDVLPPPVRWGVERAADWVRRPT